MDAQIGFAKALRWFLPTTLASYLQFRGWIRQDTLCDRSSVTFILRQCAAGLIVVYQPTFPFGRRPGPNPGRRGTCRRRCCRWRSLKVGMYKNVDADHEDEWKYRNPPIL